MSKRSRLRRLTVGEVTWLWSVRHTCRECREALTLRAEGSDAMLRLVFYGGPGRAVAGYPLHTGAVCAAGVTLNLHEPGVVRRFVDEAVAREVLPVPRGVREIDGWPLFDTLTAGD
ncbi:hypothetical protein ACIQNU_23390 [Streptomyces sp. NPDC091292]|uniref:hypothetical protein n=1 Tax=Streptomyces sp. NPDC091292 TaxID=3365991 RepID=UPI00380AF84D